MNIYVGNLSLETTEDELRRVFTMFGEVISVTLMNDRYIGSGQRRGYAYIEMASKSEGAIAIANLEGKKLRNLSFSIVEAMPLSNKSEIAAPDVKDNNRSNRTRQRINHMI